ncbi:hypothetical protein MJ572_20000 [Escherichia coli]|nr:hypothetical protein MJ572_20000 [Escherichia coli]
MKNRTGIAALSWRTGYAVCRARKIAGLSFRGARKQWQRSSSKTKKLSHLSYQLATIKTDVELELTWQTTGSAANLGSGRVVGAVQKV